MGPSRKVVFFHIVEEAVQEYFLAADPCSCPVFQRYLPYILQDRGEEERITEVALRLLSGRTKYVLLVGTLLAHDHVDVLLNMLWFGCYLQWSMIKLPALAPTCLC